MPIHDWTKVPAGIFHDFHVTWLTHIKASLNAGLLPSDFYALAEQQAGDFGPDVLTLHAPDEQFYPGNGDGNRAGSVVLDAAPPRTRYRIGLDETRIYAAKANRLVVHHVSGDKVIAVLELLSPGNKSDATAIEAFVRKARTLVGSGVHLVLIDLFPPTPRDPSGIHERIWGAGNVRIEPGPDQDRACAAYRSARTPEAFVEPLAVGDTVPEMPLFISSSDYIPLPLEQTYMAAFNSVPTRYQKAVDRL